MSKRACVIGSGFAGLSAACHLAKHGYQVQLLEKNSQFGGRARELEVDGFRFDMGPSWYWMPDVFERFFAAFGKQPSDYYQLTRLDPSYGVKFKDEIHDIPASMAQFEELCESIEPGSAQQLRKFLAQASYKYQVGINDLVYKPSRSITEFFDYRLLHGLLKMDVFTSMRSHIRKFFKTEKLQQLMEFPVLFLGATPADTPALYSLMNYADISLGTWYPMGGMTMVAKGMVALAKELGVEMHSEQEVLSFRYQGKNIEKIVTDKAEFEADIIVCGADYQYIDQHILDPERRDYSKQYWEKRVLAPSSLLFYMGLDTPLPAMRHHMLFFDEDFDQHAHEIYTDPQWPIKPLIYTSVTSKTDQSVAPTGKENLVVLMPVAPDLPDTPETRDKYFDQIVTKLESFNGVKVKENLLVKRSYAHANFKEDYHSFKGNAYGLANTLMQTAILKPRLKSKKVKNLYYTGQLTVPGPGVPPSLISGEVVSKEVIKDFG